MTSVAWADYRAPELRRFAERDAVVIVPIGSTEQHGPHLPVQVDALLVGEVARRAAEQAAARRPVLVLPTIWTGLAEHHMSFGGTITLAVATFTALLRDVCASLRRHGFRKILLLNGHGGNVAALTVIVGELAPDIDAAIATATYFQAAQPEFSGILEHQSGIRHACEGETSMLLALRPDLVDQDAMRALSAPAEGLGPVGGVYRWRPMQAWSESGVIGRPSAATAEKGERLLHSAAQVIAARLCDDALWAEQPAAEGWTRQ